MISCLYNRLLPTLLLFTIAMLATDGCKPKDDPRLASPKSAAKTLFQAMYDNDVATAKSCVVAGPGQAELVEAMTKMTAAMRRTVEAAVKRYGDEFAKLAGNTLDMTHIDPKQIDAGSETITGESATIVFQDGQTTLRLVQSERVWKVDLTQSFGGKVNMADPLMKRVVIGSLTAMTRAAEQTKANIEAGKYPSARPAVLALLANMKSAVEEEKAKLMKEYKAK